MLNGVFSFSPSAALRPLLIAALLALAILLVRGLGAPHLVRIGVRNVPRRRLRTLLIVSGLMLASTFVAAALAVDDTISLAVKTVAVYNLGRVDEDVTGGFGPLKAFPQDFGDDAAAGLRGNPKVAGVAPALVMQNLLVADQTARQVRGTVLAFGLSGNRGGPLTDLRALNGTTADPVSALGSHELYLNRNLAFVLNAHPGDTIYLYSDQWPGQREQFHVRDVATGGVLGDMPAIVLPLATLQGLAHAPGRINHIYVANAGDGLTGVGYSDSVAQATASLIPGFLHIDTAKADGVRLSLQAQDIFGRILLLFTLFALAIGLLLIFLIFVLLAAERRAELGMARALGMRRAHVVWMLLFEGSVYDATAAALGLLAGLLLGVVIVAVVSPTIAKIGFPLKVDLEPGTMLVAFCLGLVFTLVTTALAAWTVTRMTVAAALRDLPEPPPPTPTLWVLARNALILTGHITPVRAASAWGALLWGLTTRGIVPFFVGRAMLLSAIDTENALFFSLGLSLSLAGIVLAVRWLALAVVGAIARRTRPADAGWIVSRGALLADRFTALLIGGGLALYWSLPFDALQTLGLTRFSGGIEMFFVAGVMMVFGAVFALAPNLDLLLAPLRWALTRLSRLRHVTAIAFVYPAAQRFRTAIGLALFALVCFTMVVMACIANSTTSTYDNLPQMAAGYDVAGQPLFSQVGGISSVERSIGAAAPSTAQDIAAASVARPVPVAVLQANAPRARWALYPAQEVQGAFLDGTGLPLVARAPGFATDADVWNAVRTHPGDVVIDVAALSGSDTTILGQSRPDPVSAQQFVGAPIPAGLSPLLNVGNGGRRQTGAQSDTLNELGALAANANGYALQDYTLHLNGVATGSGAIAPTPLWIADLRGGAATKVTVVGILENTRGQRYGMYGSPQTFAPTERGLQPFGNEYYYFKLKPGADSRADSLAIGSALIDNGFETTVVQDALLDINGPRVFISRVLVGLVGLTLLVGMAALAVTGSRAVVERRQQIGMLRALGFRRLHVQLIFLLEALLVGVAGTLIGLVLGLVLCRNVFAVDFFSAFQSGLTLVVPWGELGAICLAAVLASLVAALLPAWQAGHVSPADALRYE